MTPRLLPAGDRAVLLHTGDLATTLAVTSHLRRARLTEVEDLIPASETVLIRVAAGTDIAEFGARALDVAAGAPLDVGDDDGGAPLVIPVRYDGPDLTDVATQTGLSIPEVIRAHTGTPWRAAFVGFAPGFAYLAGGDPRLNVPRRKESRTSVPSGSVALAGEFSAVYPRQSPGGWQIIGSTDAVLWDIDAEPPAAIRPGSWVRFVDIAAVNVTDVDVAVVDVDAVDVAAVEIDTARDSSTHDKAPDPSSAARRRGGAIMTGCLTVVRTGPLALLQDTGRTGHAADGVGRSGAADRGSYALANALVGNPPGAVAIECTLGGLVVRGDTDLVVAVTGAPAVTDVDGEPVEHATAVTLGTGQTLRLRTPKVGLRSYLAVGGGIAVPPVLGSASSDTLSGLGPAPLAKGDELPIGTHDRSTAGPDGGRATVIGEPVTSLRALLGPRDDWFVNPTDLAAGEWQVSPHSNRVGVRLDRPAASPDAGPESCPPSLQRSITREMPSEGLPLGAIQVPPSGQPVIFLADHPLTGGYPVIAVVLDDDIDRTAQVRPGQRLRFVLTS